MDTEVEEEKRNRLRNFESNIYSCMCSLSIALRSIGSDVSNDVTIDILNPTFLGSATPLSSAINRTYKTMNDGSVLMDFLYNTYEIVEVIMHFIPN